MEEKQWCPRAESSGFNSWGFNRWRRPLDKEEEDSKRRWELKTHIIVTGHYRPSAEEVRDHMITHWPFRSWCIHCIKGKCKGLPHPRSDISDNDRTPTISLDYTYMHSKDGNDEEDEGQHGIQESPMLVMIDSRPRMIFRISGREEVTASLECD